MCIAQIKPLENGDYESVLKRPPSTSNNASYPKKSEVCSEPQSKSGYEDVFHVYHSNQTLVKRGLRKCTKDVLFDVYHANQNLGNLAMENVLITTFAQWFGANFGFFWVTRII